MLIHIRGVDLPGDGGVRVGVQRRNRPDELLDLYPGDAKAVEWTLEGSAVQTEEGWDIKGRYIQGGPGGRFIYLSWGTVDRDGVFAMFRRAKLMLAAVPEATVEEAVRSGRLEGRLGLTDRCGDPLCAAVRPPVIQLSAGA